MSKYGKIMWPTSILVGIVVLIGAAGTFFVTQSSFAFEDYITYSDFGIGSLNPQEWKLWQEGGQFGSGFHQLQPYRFARPNEAIQVQGAGGTFLFNDGAAWLHVSYRDSPFVPQPTQTMLSQKNFKGYKTRMVLTNVHDTGGNLFGGSIGISLRSQKDMPSGIAGGCQASYREERVEGRRDHVIALDWSLNEQKYSFSIDGREQCEGNLTSQDAYLAISITPDGGSGSSINLFVEKVVFRPIAGLPIDPDDVVVFELKNRDQELSIFSDDLRYSFPNGGFKKMYASLPAIILRQGRPSFDFNAELYGRMAGGEIIDIDREFPDAISIGVFYIVDNRIANIPTACNPRTGGIYNINTSQCESQNAIVVTGQGGVFNTQSGTFSFAGRLPCAGRSEFNLVVTDAVNGNCTANSILIGRQCYTCQQNPAIGGICQGTIDPQGRCIAIPVFECPTGSVPIERDERNNIIRCQVTATGQSVPVVQNQQIQLQRAQDLATPEGRLRRQLRSTGIYLLIAVPIGLLIIGAVALFARRKKE